MTTVLGMFAKPPVPGTVKTRLAADIGDDSAAELYAAFVDDLIEKYCAVADHRILGFGGRESTQSREWAETVAGSLFETWSQPSGDLGTRIDAFFRHAHDMGGHLARVVLIGSDSPNLPQEYVEQAFEVLCDHDFAIGPAVDGGYYLIGMCGFRADVFDGVEWSSERVLEQTQANIERMSATVGLLPEWYDVDTVAEARKLWADVQAAQSDGLARTRTVLQRLF